jgi:hypothetical protein|tara:strand:+ start:980 stop:1192 length:213 start_codon:yes stop_codon:yes gene_type:complete
MNDNINIIKRQTDYNHGEIIKKLKEHQNDIEKIILEYNNVNMDDINNEKIKNMSNNQKIFKVIRETLKKE